MHKRIVDAIKFILNGHNNQISFDVFVREQQTGGFWGMMVFIKNPHLKHMIKQIGYMALAVGRFYGEALAIEEGEDWIKID